MSITTASPESDPISISRFVTVFVQCQQASCCVLIKATLINAAKHNSYIFTFSFSAGIQFVLTVPQHSSISPTSPQTKGVATLAKQHANAKFRRLTYKIQ